MPKLLILCLFVVFCFLQPATLLAQESEGQSISFKLLRDVPMDFEIEDICCKEDLIVFPKQEIRGFRTDFVKTSYWMKIANVEGIDLIQLTPIIDDATLYTRKNSGGAWQKIRTGDQVINTRIDLVSPFMALPLPKNIDESEIYIHVVQSGAVSISAIGWNLPSFMAMQSTDQIMKIFLLGCIFSIVIYNVFVSLLVKDIVFMLNAFCVLSMLTLSLYLSGYGNAYIWHALIGWSNTILVSSIFFTIIFGSLFMWAFLRSKGDSIVTNWQLFVGSALAIIVAFCAIFLPFGVIQLGMMLSGVVLLVSLFWVLTRKAMIGDKKARTLLAPLILAIIPGFTMIILNKIFGIKLVHLGNNGLEFTLSIEAILFSLALAYRIRLTEREAHQANAQVLALTKENSAKAVAAQDAERRRLAKELHDGIGQDFLVIHGNLKMLAADNKLSGYKNTILDIIQLSAAALNGLRRVSRDMHPAMIEHLGLEKALYNLLENFKKSQVIEIKSHLELSDVNLSQEAELHIFRIVQECISNISRHSNATKCEIVINSTGDKLNIMIDDDGIGLNTISNGATTSLGFVSINERVETLGGRWEKKQGHLSGLGVLITLPLTETK